MKDENDLDEKMQKILKKMEKILEKSNLIVTHPKIYYDFYYVFQRYKKEI